MLVVAVYHKRELMKYSIRPSGILNFHSFFLPSPSSVIVVVVVILRSLKYSLLNNRTSLILILKKRRRKEREREKKKLNNTFTKYLLSFFFFYSGVPSTPFSVSFYGVLNNYTGITESMVKLSNA